MEKGKENKIDKLKNEYESIWEATGKLRSHPIERLEEIAKFTNKFDKFMKSQGYTRDISTNFDYSMHDFWFLYKYFKEPTTNNMKINMSYKIDTDNILLSAWSIKTGELFDIFKFLEVE